MSDFPLSLRVLQGRICAKKGECVRKDCKHGQVIFRDGENWVQICGCACHGNSFYFTVEEK